MYFTNKKNIYDNLTSDVSEQSYWEGEGEHILLSY